MRIRLRAPDRARPALLASAVVAIVLGILGMHGVDAHGVSVHGAMSRADAATSSVTSSASLMPVHGAVGLERGDVHPTAHPGMSAAIDASPDLGVMDGMGGMVMLCVAMLAGAAALLGLLVHRGRPTKVWAVLQQAGPGWNPQRRVLRVGTGPPSVWRFSVIRC